MWWKRGPEAMPELPMPKSQPESSQRSQRYSRGGKGGGRAQASDSKNTPTPPHLSKRQRARTDLASAAEIPAGHMSDDGGSSFGGSQRSMRGRDANWSSRKPPTRRSGRKYHDKSAICDVPNDPVHHHWMQMVSQGLHQALMQTRKAGGQAYDTWICGANHSLATAMMRMAEGHNEKAITTRQQREQARRESRDMPPPLPNPAADFIARFIIELKKHSLGNGAKEALDTIWEDIRQHANLIEDVSYFNVSKVSDGEETRIVIGMKGWAMRPKLMEVMRQFGSEVRYSSGGAHLDTWRDNWGSIAAS